MFLSLDFLYIPTKHPNRDIKYYVEILGGTLLFRVKAMGTEVAGVRMSEQGPLALLAEHLEGTLPILIYRVPKLRSALREMERRGWKRAEVFEIPHGPCCSFVAEGGQRLALYELTRPGATEHFTGRFD